MGGKPQWARWGGTHFAPPEKNLKLENTDPGKTQTFTQLFRESIEFKNKKARILTISNSNLNVSDIECFWIRKSDTIFLNYLPIIATEF